jgi:type 1 glutamine amidotransferase
MHGQIRRDCARRHGDNRGAERPTFLPRQRRAHVISTYIADTSPLIFPDTRNKARREEKIMQDKDLDKNEKTGDQDSNKGLTRRNMLGSAAVAASLSALPAMAQTPAPAPPPAGGRPAAGGAPRITPGGTGPIKVLFISKYHPFDRENLFLTLDGMGKDITWTHVEHPAAEVFFDPKNAAPYDVFLFYDAYTGRVQKANPDGTTTTSYDPPSSELVANTKKLLQQGDKGFVFLHHAIAAWVHSWPAGLNGSNAYVEVTGGAADWGSPIKNIRGVDYPISGAKGRTPQHISIIDKNHPITQGVEDFDITDEAYLCPMFEDSVHCFMRSSFKPTASEFAPRSAGHPDGSNMTGWVKTAERSPVCYMQHGHDLTAWGNPAFQKLLLNMIKWAASPEAKTWAHANAKRIFV